MEKHFLIKILEWGAQQPEGFNYQELSKSFEFKDWELAIIKNYFENARANFYHRGMANYNYIPETIFYAVSGNPNESYNSPNTRYVITSEALFNYIDYQELKFARENAKEAKNLAILAIIVSAIMPLIIAWLVTQSVRIVS